MNGSEINFIDKQGNTALHSAVKAKGAGHIQVISVLLEAGIDINLRNNQGDTALHLAVKNSDYEAAKILLAAGADANVINKNGDVPLHIATRKGDQSVINALLFTGRADANIANEQKNNNTPLHIAAQKGDQHVTDALLKGRANANLVNKQGQTPWNLAVQRRHIGIVNLLEFFAKQRLSNNKVASSTLETIASIMQQRLTRAAITFDFFPEGATVSGNNNVQTGVQDGPSLAK